MLIKKISSYCISIILGMQSFLCFAETNYATNSHISASSVEGESAINFAIDGNIETFWNSGVHPPSWIEFDFGSSKEVTEIKALVDQTPSGDTVHKVYVDDTLGHTWAGVTETGNELTWTLPAGINAQKIRIETESSPSWVAWKEISILGPDDAPIPNPDIQPQNNFAVLADNLDIHFTLIEYKSAQPSIFYRASLTYIGNNANNEMLWKLKDHKELSNSNGYSNTPTVDELSNLFIKINYISFGKVTYRAELEFIGDNGEPGAFVWRLKSHALN